MCVWKDVEEPVKESEKDCQCLSLVSPGDPRVCVHVSPIIPLRFCFRIVLHRTSFVSSRMEDEQLDLAAASCQLRSECEKMTRGTIKNRAGETLFINSRVLIGRSTELSPPLAQITWKSRGACVRARSLVPAFTLDHTYARAQTPLPA